MVRSLHYDDVGAEVWAQKQAQGLDHIGLLGLAAGQAQLGELFVWAQHHKLRAVNNSGGDRKRN